MVTVGVFDSGVGGLSVVRQIFNRIPGVQLMYYGDTARVPYGAKSKEELIYLADIVTNFLLQEGSQIIIDACNSTSAVALDYLHEKYNIPILGVIEPGAVAALKATKNGRIGLIGTEATVKTGIHAKLISSLNPDFKVISQACPGFVPLIENGDVSSSKVQDLAKLYLKPLQKEKIDTLILGCTHYPFLEQAIAAVMGTDVKLIDPAVETVIELERILVNRFSREDKIGIPKQRFIVSGDPNHFKRVANLLSIGKKIDEVESIFIK
jgi:glutamate racemase